MKARDHDGIVLDLEPEGVGKMRQERSSRIANYFRVAEGVPLDGFDSFQHPLGEFQTQPLALILVPPEPVKCSSSRPESASFFMLSANHPGETPRPSWKDLQIRQHRVSWSVGTIFSTIHPKSGLI